jgi:hypothetical protein
MTSNGQLKILVKVGFGTAAKSQALTILRASLKMP